MFKLFRTIVKPHFQCSIKYSSLSSSSSSITNAIVNNYLINSLGFPVNDAVAVSSEVPTYHLKSTANFDLVVNLFKDYGLNSTQIKEIISYAPKILTCKATKTLAPKLRFFQELGLPGPDLVTLVRRNRYIFWKGLDTKIIPTVDFYRTLLGGCDKKVIELINRSKWMLVANTTVTRISQNISLLKKYAVSDEMIYKTLIKDPQRMKLAPELLESKLQYVEEKLGISRDLPIFIYGFFAIMYRSDEEIENIIRVFRTFGWSDDQINTLVKSQPYCLDRSEAYIVDKLNFFMKELDYSPLYLMGCTSFWTLSLEKRMKPRNEVFKILKEKELVKDIPSFATVVKYTESKFLDYLKKFECHVPNLCETYLNSIKRLAPE
ncbi:transcription termination factor MTERF8, chloroplastic-like [Rutidosis leptorrhynchoides]|uniref:transcription termination factor MTERF8, chloroplastic-like n=1 Tax=Rutidosis leptorrhynchoides TaxID=125765 RepID=UPI003A992082